MGLVEVPDVAPGRARWSRAGVAFEEALHRCELAVARWAVGKHVEAAPRDADAERDGLNRSILADDVLDRRQVVGGREVEYGRVATRAQIGRDQGIDGGQRGTPDRRRTVAGL
jgi:hypothetical protein